MMIHSEFLTGGDPSPRYSLTIGFDTLKLPNSSSLQPKRGQSGWRTGRVYIDNFAEMDMRKLKTFGLFNSKEWRIIYASSDITTFAKLDCNGEITEKYGVCLRVKKTDD